MISLERGHYRLHLHRMLVRSALAAANLFSWIFVFQYFFARSSNLGVAFVSVALLYTLSQIITLLLTPYAAAQLRHGTVGPMFQGIVCAALAYAALAISFSGVLGNAVAIGILSFAILRGVYRSLYWVPYQVEAAKFTGGLSLITLQELFIILLPAICGIILTAGLTAVQFILVFASGLLLISSLVLLKLPNTPERFSFGYMETFMQLFSERHGTLTLISILDGISGAALLLFWPLAVFLIVGWSYAVLGVVLSLTYVVVFFTRSSIRSWLKRSALDASVAVHALLASSSWILRLVVSSPLGVVLVDSYFYAGNPVRGSGVDHMTHEQSADGGSYVDEFTALKEMGLALGKIAITLVGALCATVLSLPTTFIVVFVIAAAASGTSVYLARQEI